LIKNSYIHKRLDLKLAKIDYTTAKLGRIFILRLHDSDRIHEVIEFFAIRKKIFAALCFFLGGAKENSKIVVGPKDGDSIPPIPIITLLKGVHEAQGIGTIATNEKGKPTLHMHTSFGRQQHTITGCIRLGVDVWKIGEVVLFELVKTKISRLKHRETGFEFLEIKK